MKYIELSNLGPISKDSIAINPVGWTCTLDQDGKPYITFSREVSSGKFIPVIQIGFESGEDLQNFLNITEKLLWRYEHSEA